MFSGSLSLDHLRRARLLSRAQTEKKLGISLKQRTILALYHPVTLMRDTAAEAEEMFAALSRRKEQILFVYPNADAGSRRLLAKMERFVGMRANAHLFVNLDHPAYLSLLRHVDLLMGNSSSGMIESTSLGIPTLNIGLRQQGREHAANVLNVPAERGEILRAMSKALSAEFRRSAQGLENPYGDGQAVKKIVQTLAKTRLGEKLLFKN
jgi:UDP-N-acetylglucosamine 2-epimerase (non-hydrolysing)/GDP/UDP-N,N'-diacetylbacillosamine 2-epimerase (hydrolysing)